MQPSSDDLRPGKRPDETRLEYARRKERIAEARRKARVYQVHIYEERLKPVSNPTNKRVEVV